MIIRKKIFDREFSKLINSKLKNIKEIVGSEESQNMRKNEEVLYNNLYFNNNQVVKGTTRKEINSKKLNQSDVTYDISNINEEKINSKNNITKNEFRSSEMNKNNKSIDNKSDDDVEMIDKLSLLNMGARYELIDANNLLVDFNLVIINQKYHSKNSNKLKSHFQDNLFDSKTFQRKRFENPAKIIKQYKNKIL